MAWTTPATATAGDELTAAFWNAQVRDNWNAAFPVGSLHWRMQAGTTTETTIDGFVLEANGVAVSRTTYSALNTKLSGLSYPFGSGNGSTTMTLPDLAGRTPVSMASGGNANVDAVGDSDGNAKASRNPKAAMTVSGTTGSESSHTHLVTPSQTPAEIATTGSAVVGGSNAATSGPGSAHSHSFSGTATPLGFYAVVGILCVKY